MAPLQLASVDAVLAWLVGRGVRSLCVDSRQVRAGDGFIAWPGHAVDGRQFVGEALAAGAAAALVEAGGVEIFAFADERVAAIAGLKEATGEIASRRLGEPSRKLLVIACTGTNGKTSIAWWTAQALTALGRRCGVVGTLGVGEPPLGDRPAVLTETGLTTPDPVGLQTAFARFADAGMVACAIEASSIGLAEHRLAGTTLAVAIFSNFTQDHLDFHGSMASYWQAKARLFTWPGLAAASINVDDAHGRRLADELAGKRPADALVEERPAGALAEERPAGAAGGVDLWTYSVRGRARLSAVNIAYRDGGLCFEVVEAGGDRAAVTTQMIGGYNVANLLAVLGGLRALGLSLADAAGACSALTPVPGRMQRVPAGADQPVVVVDYAHTPDALEQALRALQPFAAERNGVLWCVFGCGGNRDAAKRPLMGAVATRLAQRVVVTSDNPRHEPPEAIINQVLGGVWGGGGGSAQGAAAHRGHISKGGEASQDSEGSEGSDGTDGTDGRGGGSGSAGRVVAIEDRAAAIATAIREADRRDVILIAGKGHETFQETAGRKRPFVDADEALAALVERAGATA